MQRLAVFVLILAAFGAGGVMLAKAGHQRTALETPRKAHSIDPKIAARDKFVKSVKTAVTEKLIDPDSAKFRNLYYVEQTWNNDGTPGGPALCGEINARNRFGGYAGFKRFWYMPGHSAQEPLFGLVCDGDMERSCMIMHQALCKDEYKKVPLPS